MKKIIIFSVVIAGLAMASCKKDYLCACNSTTTSSSGTVTGSTDTTFTNASKSEAETKCNSLESNGNFGGFSWETTCELK